MATFWRPIHHDGKITLVWWGWVVHGLFLSLYLPSRTKVWWTLRLRGQILVHPPISPLPLYHIPLVVPIPRSFVENQLLTYPPHNIYISAPLLNFFSPPPPPWYFLLAPLFTVLSSSISPRLISDRWNAGEITYWILEYRENRREYRIGRLVLILLRGSWSM
jgi:hypothetical protein